MLRRTCVNNVVYYASPLLEAAGIPHAFSTRIGGISPVPFASLNLGNPNGCDIQDDYQHIWENYRILQAACGLANRELLRLHQVHGEVVVIAKRNEPFDTSTKADAIVTDEAARAASVRTADCVPVLLSTSDGKKVAAIHAGWKGVIAGVVPKAIEQMTPDVNQRRALIAALGPCIGMDAFEVGPEVLQAFAERFGQRAPLRRRADGKGHVDLRGAIALQLSEAGLSRQRIDTTDQCTASNPAEFFSHRRDNGITGRMSAIIGPRGR